MGIAAGLAMLSRGELVLVVPLVALPLVLHGAPTWRRRPAMFGIVVGAAGIVVGPWIGFNLVRFKEPEFITTEFGAALSATSCDDESESDRAWRRAALAYRRGHLDRLPGTVAARVGRLWDVYRPMQNLQFDTHFEQRGEIPSRLNMVAHYRSLPFAAIGLVALRRQRVPIWPLLAMAMTGTLAAAIIWGGTRLRITIDVALIVAAGVGLATASRSARRRMQDPSTRRLSG